MSLYENNYLRLRRLLGDLRSLPDRMVSSAPHDLPLHVTVLERCRYTTSLHLTYYFAAAVGQPLADPDLSVKLYHDARLVEASQCRPNHRHHLFREFSTDAGDELSRRWAMNRMLNKWLDYCLTREHRFPGQR